MTDFTCSGNLNVIENLTVGQPEYYNDNPFNSDNGLVNCTINGRMFSRTLTSDYLYGKLYGSIHAVDGTKILDNGYNGTDAIFTGNVNGNLSGEITLSGQQESINDIGNGLKINNNKLESAGWILTQPEGLLAENRPGKQLYTDSNNVDSVSISSHIEVGKEQASTSNFGYAVIGADPGGDANWAIFSHKDRTTTNGYNPCLTQCSLGTTWMSGSDLTFQINGSNKMRLANNGSFGIGTMTPQPEYRLEVAGITKMTGDLEITGNVIGDIKGDILSSDGSKILENGTDGTDATFTGNVIGDIKLSNESSFLNKIGNGLALNNGSLEVSASSASAGWYFTESDELYTKSGEVKSFTINITNQPSTISITRDSASGITSTFIKGNLILEDNLGIGTNTPTEKLDIVGNTKMTGDLHVTGGSVDVDNVTNFNEEVIFTHGTGSSSHIHYGSTQDWYIRSGVSSGKVIIQDTGGNVGIGTSSPSAKLDVNGATKITGNLDVTGDLDVTGTLDVNNRNLSHKIGTAQIGKVGTDSNYAGLRYHTFNSNNDYAILTDKWGNTFINAVGNGSKIHFRIANSGTDAMEINDKRAVQINDSNGATTGTLYRLRWTSNNSASFGGAVGSAQYCLRVRGRLWAEGQLWYSGGAKESDRRIKSHIEEVEERETLDIIHQIKSRKYNFINPKDRPEGLTHSGRVYGFIAQEVGEIRPELVSNHTRFIPNVFCIYTNDEDLKSFYNNRCESLEYIHTENKILLKISLIPDSYNEETETYRKVKFNARENNLAEEEELELEISYNDENYSYLEIEKEYLILLCIGVEIDDFKSLDYDSLFALYHKAIQDLDTKQQELVLENTQLKNSVKTLETQLSDVLTRLSNLENTLNN